MHIRLITFVVLAVAISGCSADSNDPVAQAAMSSAKETGKPRPRGDQASRRGERTTPVRLQKSDYGPVLFDRNGGALYLFTADASAKSTCYGACARAWPPFIARGRVRGRAGVDQELLGTTRRRNGKRQVTYGGHPLYYYVHDPPNVILCHDVFEFGGDWLVVRGSGDPAPG